MDFKHNSPYEKFKKFIYQHKDKQYLSIVSSPDYISFIETFPTIPYKIALINHDVQNRPDLLSYAAYGDVGYWWLIILFNGIIDPFSDLVVDKEIKIPVLS
jgi:hypothetical protein